MEYCFVDPMATVIVGILHLRAINAEALAQLQQ
jgi:hypothetical protein